VIFVLKVKDLMSLSDARCASWRLAIALVLQSPLSALNPP